MGQETELAHAVRRIAENPYDYEAHLKAIANCEKNMLSEARKNMAQYFPLDLTLWTDWINDEPDLQSKIKLHRLALQDYQCISVLTSDIPLHESLINTLVDAHTNGNLASLDDVFTQCRESLDHVGLNFKEVLVN
jgi:hypothetical protein